VPNALVTEEERQRHLEHQKAYQARWKARDPEGFRAYRLKCSRLYRARHPEVVARRARNCHKRDRKAVLPPYARHLLAKEVQRSGVPCPSDILPPELVSAWADITKLRRLFAKKTKKLKGTEK